MTSKSGRTARLAAGLLVTALLPFILVEQGRAQTATDPGYRILGCGTNGNQSCVGGFVSGLNTYQSALESTATGFFDEINNVAGGTSIKHVGLGPGFDSNSCNSCHAGPAVGGGNQPPTTVGGTGNPLFAIYQLMGATNSMPSFEMTNGPTLVARFPYASDLVTPDGHVHQLFTITGRSDAGTCNLQQPDFQTAYDEGNLINRSTSPAFGGGLVETIEDQAIIANMEANGSLKMSLGISGHPNTNADDGSVNRFGWKAQERTLMTFGGGAYQVEEGVSDELFPNDINDQAPGCTPPFPLGPPNGNGTHGVPDDRTDFAVTPANGGASNCPPASDCSTGFLFNGDPERFAIFMRFLAAPTPATSCPGGGNCTNGQTQFNNVGCVLCHQTSFTTPTVNIAALSNVTVNLFSDLLVHDMGPCLADNVTQGSATGDQFRTMPLWGVGQRYFFLHDGRTSNIVTAVEDHYCLGNGVYPNSEANAVVDNFNALSTTNQQDLVDFLRSL